MFCKILDELDDALGGVGRAIRLDRGDKLRAFPLNQRRKAGSDFVVLNYGLEVCSSG